MGVKPDGSKLADVSTSVSTSPRTLVGAKPGLPGKFPEYAPQIRRSYRIDAPKCIQYLYGNSEFDRRLGECRDEQAWTAAIEYAEHEATPNALQLAVLHMRPGVSKREARRALDKLFESFPRKPQPKRPAIRHQERQVLREIFELTEKIARSSLQPSLLVKCAVGLNAWLADKCGWPLLDEKTIWRECRRWRIDTGRAVRPCKTYIVDKIPRSPRSQS